MDLKSISSYGLKKRMEEGVDPAHAAQLTRYYLKLKDRYSITRGIIWYLSKDGKPGLTDLECVVTFDEELLASTQADLEAEQTAWKGYLSDHSLPDMLPLETKGKPSWKCQYCAFAGHCDTAHQAGNKYLAGIPNGN